MNFIDNSSVKMVGSAPFVAPDHVTPIIHNIARGAWYVFQTPFVIARNMHERK